MDRYATPVKITEIAHKYLERSQCPTYLGIKTKSPTATRCLTPTHQVFWWKDKQIIDLWSNHIRYGYNCKDCLSKGRPSYVRRFTKREGGGVKEIGPLQTNTKHGHNLEYTTDLLLPMRMGAKFTNSMTLWK